MALCRILGNFRENGNFNNFSKNIFANDPRGQHKRCGMVILPRNLISRLSKICEICENKAMQKFPVYGMSYRIRFLALIGWVCPNIMYIN